MYVNIIMLDYYLNVLFNKKKKTGIHYLYNIKYITVHIYTIYNQYIEHIHIFNAITMIQK